VVVWSSDETQRGSRHVIPKNGLSIGRDPGNVLLLNEMTVSGHHCRIDVEGDKVILRDLGSTNGTYVGETRINEQELSGGEQIWLSATILKYLTGTDITAQFHKVVSELATTDNITGVYNARYLRDALDRLAARSARNSESLTVIALSLDHARQMESSYGDAVVERILVDIARRLKEPLPPDAVIGRDGAVGFLIALPGAPLEEGAPIASLVLAAVNERDFEVDPYSIAATLSIGVAELDESESASDLMKLARERRYAAERAGGNQVRESALVLRRLEDAEWMLRKMVAMSRSGAVVAFEIEDENLLLGQLGRHARDEWYKQLVDDVEAYILESDMIATWQERYVLAGLLDRSEVAAAAVARNVRERWTSRPIPERLEAEGARALRSAVLGPEELRGFKDAALDQILTRLVQRNDTSPEAAATARLPFPIAVTPAVVESRPTSLARTLALAWGVEIVLRFAVAVQLSFLAAPADSGLRRRVADALRPFTRKALSIGEWDDLAYKLALLCVPARMGPLACVPQLLAEVVAGRSMRSLIGGRIRDHIKRVGRDSGRFDRPEENNYDIDEEVSLRATWNLILKHLRPLGDCRLVSVQSMEVLDNEEGSFGYRLRELRGSSEHFTIKGDTLNAALLKECCYLLAPDRPPLSLAPLLFAKTCATCRRMEVFVADELALGPQPDQIPVRGVTSDHEMSVDVPKHKWMDELYKLIRSK
jgi:diguanylate cyclase (GGDEF)-like protein